MNTAKSSKAWIGFGAGILIGLLFAFKTRGRKRVIIGLPDEWNQFATRNAAFLETLPLLFDTVEATFSRTVNLDLADRTVYFLSKIAAEDFTEVFILCGNGHGIGGLKILRGMYERVVTLNYIHKHPSDAEAFWHYHSIHKYKMLQHARSAMDVDRYIPKATQEAIENARNDVKHRYLDACEKCGKQRPLPSWIKGGIDTLALKTTAELRQRYYYCYYWPTLHDHATVNNIMERLEDSQGEHLRWNDDAQRGWADIAVSSGHGLLIDVLDLNNSHFQLGFDEHIKKLEDGWRRAWLKAA